MFLQLLKLKQQDRNIPGNNMPESQPYTRLHCLAGRDQQWELHLSICLLNEAAAPGINEN